MKRLIAGLAILVFVLVAAAFASVLAPEDPNAMNLSQSLRGPSVQHPLGQDENGGDVLAKMLYGARVSLMISGSVVGISLLLGLLIGSLAGWSGGWIELFTMSFVDMVYAFPSFLLALSLVAVLGPSITNLILALCLTSWTGFARLVRGEILHLKEREYIQASRALGASSLRTLCFHLWPNLFGLLSVQATFALAGVIIAEAGLSFLGLGVPASTPTWGALLNSGRRVLIEAPHISFAAGAGILSVVLAFNLIGDGLRQFLRLDR